MAVRLLPGDLGRPEETPVLWGETKLICSRGIRVTEICNHWKDLEFFSVLLRRGLKLVRNWTHSWPGRTDHPPMVSREAQGPRPKPRAGPADQPGLCPNATAFEQFNQLNPLSRAFNLIKTVDKLFRFSEYQIIYTDIHEDMTLCLS